MEINYRQTQQLLDDLESELRRLGLWQATPPSKQALASNEPFCVDTLELSQWLQFVFIPKMHQLIVLAMPLPTAISVLPMAEEAYLGSSMDVKRLLGTIGQLDTLLSYAK